MPIISLNRLIGVLQISVIGHQHSQNTSEFELQNLKITDHVNVFGVDLYNFNEFIYLLGNEN